MNSARAAQFLRSCTGSLSPARTAARAPAHANASMRRAALARRLYSDDKTQSTTEQQKGGSSSGSSSADEAVADASQESELVQKLKQKEAEVTDVMSRLRYLQADFLNLQRNAAREKEQTRDFAITRFASDLLETVDVLAIALKSVPTSALSPPTSSESESAAAAAAAPPSSANSSDPSKPPEKSAQAYLSELYTGVEMTHRLLQQTLFKYHVKPFDPTGEKFDPNRHEALYQAPIPGKEPGTVHDCQKTGYTIKDRVLRAAQVGVVQDTQS